jgi:hypothetical protein
MGLLLLDFPDGAIGKSHAMCRARTECALASLFVRPDRSAAAVQRASTGQRAQNMPRKTAEILSCTQSPLGDREPKSGTKLAHPGK